MKPHYRLTGARVTIGPGGIPQGIRCYRLINSMRCFFIIGFTGYELENVN